MTESIGPQTLPNLHETWKTDAPSSAFQAREGLFTLKRRMMDHLFSTMCFASIALALFFLGVLLLNVFSEGMEYFTSNLFLNFPSRRVSVAGMQSALLGSFWLMMIVLVVSVPIGVAGAVFLEEIMPNTRLRRFIDLNLSNLASIPSIIYGILGLAVFVRVFGFDRSLLSGGLTLALLVLPIIVIATREALRNVPESLRYAAFGLGATRWQTARAFVLPQAIPGIMTGTILAVSRAIGESAPLLIIGAFSYVAFNPENLSDTFTAMPIQIYDWVGRPQQEFHKLAASGIMVLLIFLLSANSLAIFIRNTFGRKNQCNKV